MGEEGNVAAQFVEDVIRGNDGDDFSRVRKI
jgi:hypothetical protein